MRTLGGVVLGEITASCKQL